MKLEEVRTAFDAICPGLPCAVRITLRPVPFTLHRHRWLSHLARDGYWHAWREISSRDGRADNHRIWKPLVTIGAIEERFFEGDNWFRITTAGRVLLKSWEQKFIS